MVNPGYLVLVPPGWRAFRLEVYQEDSGAGYAHQRMENTP
jgi:hypothetical protein